MPFAIIPFIIQVAASYLISRALQPDGPRLKELGATGGDYGVPMPRAFGSLVRAPGIVIAQDDIKEKKHKTGGILNTPLFGLAGVLGAFSSNYYTYSIPAQAFLLADRTNDDPIEGIEKAWANGKLIFKASTATVVDEAFGSDGKLIWRKYKKNKYFKSLTVHTGHPEDTVDPVLEDELNEDSAYLFSAYVVIENEQLADFGNAPPAHEFLFKAKTGQTLAEVAEAICGAGGIDIQRNISTTSLIDRTIRGYLVNQESSCWDGLKPLMPVFSVDAAEVSGQIRFYRRSQYMRALIPLSEMGAHIFGDEPPDKFTFKRNPDINQPQTTSLTFVDPARDYQPNTVEDSRSEGDAKSNVAMNLPLVLTADEAATTVSLMHWDAWLGRTSLNFTLMDNWIGIETGVAYGINFADQIMPYRVTRKMRGANGIIEVEALSDESVTYTASATGDSGAPPDDPSTEFAETRLLLIDGPIVDDSHDDYGFYIALAGSEAGWPRAEIQASDAGVIFDPIADLDQETIIGDVTGTLPAGTTTGLDDTLDTTSTLTVVLLHELMLLESATDGELDAGKNLAFVGKDGIGEYLQYKTATQIDDVTWELTNLRRGRKGTDWALSTHVSGEEFALLDGAGVFRVTQPITEWGNEYSFRGVTLHQDEADADIIDFTNTGEGKRPYSPVNVEGTWDGSNNLTITWDSRSRLNAGGLGIDDNAEWDIEITTGAGESATVTAETWTYTAAAQIVDGITPGDSIAGRVRQTSDVNDGRWRNFLLIGPDDTWELEDDLTPYHLEDGTTTLDLEA